MNRKRDIRAGKTTGKERKLTRRDIIVFAFFLLLSFIFWYLNSLGKDLGTNIRYPLKYTNIPKDWKLSENMPEKVSLFLSGPGYSILQMKMSGRHAPLVIDFSKVNYRQVQNNKSADYYIVTSNLIPKFNSELKSECKVTAIKPDTLFLSVR
ncbi:MAG: hypothetical protein A2V64_05220 [Bacteroidetes bacterium RBG_13_43_22]|nr:MAG: hypothetical protein A2V64_05220 [Bacteroidetes bacterium RBG_13_43_22]